MPELEPEVVPVPPKDWMKADAVEDCDWLAIDTELKLAPAAPLAVAVELPPDAFAF